MLPPWWTQWGEKAWGRGPWIYLNANALGRRQGQQGTVVGRDSSSWPGSPTGNMFCSLWLQCQALPWAASPGGRARGPASKVSLG